MYIKVILEKLVVASYFQAKMSHIKQIYQAEVCHDVGTYRYVYIRTEKYYAHVHIYIANINVQILCPSIFSQQTVYI